MRTVMIVSHEATKPFFEVEQLAKRQKVVEESEIEQTGFEQASIRQVASDVELIFENFRYFAGEETASQFYNEMMARTPDDLFLPACIRQVTEQVMKNTEIFDEENLIRVAQFAFSHFNIGQERKELEFLFRFSKIENLSSCEMEAVGEGISGAQFVKHGEERLFVQKEYKSSSSGNFYGIAPFEAAQREATAHKLADLLSFHQVPFTVCIKCSEDKLITLQTFIHSQGSLQSLSSSQESLPLLDRIPEDEVHKLAIFDTVFSNADRHLGNILITEESHLVAIDNEALLSQDILRDRPKMDYLDLRQMDAFVSGELQKTVLSLRSTSVRNLLKNLSENTSELLEKKLIFVQSAVARSILTVKETVAYVRDEHDHFCSIDLNDARRLAEDISDFKNRFSSQTSRGKQIRLIKTEGLSFQQSLGDGAEISQSMFFHLMRS